MDAVEAELIDSLADTNGVVDAADHMGVVSLIEGELRIDLRQRRRLG